MPKRVLDVGNCGPDHAAIRGLLARLFAAEVVQADHWADTAELLAAQSFDLVLVNRKLDIDYSDGMEIIRQIKRNPTYAALPVMLITNYPEHQAAAIAEGAIHGFGKRELHTRETHERLAKILAVSGAETRAETNAKAASSTT
jgi:response regulator RpfG family c-di-GMP phosphodiesterase